MNAAIRQRIALGAGFVSALCAASVLFAPEGRLRCTEPYLTEESPDGRWTINVCGRRMLFAMPGSGSDAPGWIVLRDEAGAVRGVSGLSMLQFYGATAGVETRWTLRNVERPMVFDLDLDPANGAFERWWDERIWRLRALFRLTRDDEDER
ncbi:hypothetical protein [Aureimonas psammosilenae]|uniref:hypothetical protein n=1 Tax=Aureimonas psammosilenae TaxID=2495496 RepID=UPI00126092EF|nr:hypothetical protein [Aureimonas psammosilenae]